MSTKQVTTETTLTVVKHLINGRTDTFIAEATGLAITQVQDIKVSHGYPEMHKMEWSRDKLEERVNEPAAATATPGPTIRAAVPARRHDPARGDPASVRPATGHLDRTRGQALRKRAHRRGRQLTESAHPSTRGESRWSAR